MAYIPMKKREIIEKPGTTTANGNINLGKTISDGAIISIWTTDDNYVCSPVLANGTTWYVHIRSSTSQSPVVAGTAVTVRYIME